MNRHLALRASYESETVEHWLPINPSYTEGINVADQQNDPNSMLNYYRKLLRVRKSTPALSDGDYTPLSKESDEYFAFLRTTDEQTLLVVLNYSTERQEIKYDLPQKSAQIIFSSIKREKSEESARQFTVGAFEVYIAELQ